MKEKWTETVRHGHPVRILMNATGSGFAKQDLDTRFWSKVDKSGECWRWTAGTSPDGYGKFLFAKGDTKRAHRVAWFLTHGTWPGPEKYLLHSCNEPLCVRPDHLREGTQKENIQQAVSEGRAARGERTGTAVLTEAQARAIKSAPAAERPSSIARRLGISSLSAVQQLRSGKTWRWL